MHRRDPGGERPGERGEPQAAEVAIGLALVVQARDGLLADVAALGEADGALVEAGLLWDHAVIEVDEGRRSARR